MLGRATFALLTAIEGSDSLSEGGHGAGRAKANKSLPPNLPLEQLEALLQLDKTALNVDPEPFKYLTQRRVELFMGLARLAHSIGGCTGVVEVAAEYVLGFDWDVKESLVRDLLVGQTEM